MITKNNNNNKKKNEFKSLNTLCWVEISADYIFFRMMRFGMFLSIVYLGVNLCEMSGPFFWKD